jgi:hypothetical protein
MYRLALTYDQLKQPTTARAAEIKRIEQDFLSNYALNEQLQQYMYSQKGKTTDYEFPGYDPARFSPSVGRWFRDVATGAGINPNAGAWQPPTAGINSVQPAATHQITTTSEKQNIVPLSLLPDYPKPFKIDWKSVAIGILLILAYLGLKKS